MFKPSRKKYKITNRINYNYYLSGIQQDKKDLKLLRVPIIEEQME